MAENPHKPKTKEDASFGLKVFIKKYEIIKSYSFFDSPRLRINHSWKAKDGYTESTYEGSSDEQIDAVLLHLRFFLNGNEKSSLFYLMDCFDLLDADDELKRELAEILKQRDEWQKKPSLVGDLSNSSLFDKLIYGSRIHSNSEKTIKSYNELMEFEMFRFEEKFHLSRIIDGFWAIISQIYPIVVRASNHPSCPSI